MCIYVAQYCSQRQSSYPIFILTTPSTQKLYVDTNNISNSSPIFWAVVAAANVHVSIKLFQVVTAII